MRDNKIALHAGYWLTTVIFFGTFWGSDTGDYARSFYTELVLLPPKIIATYAMLYYAIPRYLFYNKYFRFALFLFSTLLIGSLILYFTKIYLIYPYYPPDYSWRLLLNPYNLLQEMVDINTLMVLPVMAKIFKYYYKNKQAAEILAREKLEAELKFLKSQIHPHFLFNTLNSLFSLTLKKSDSAPEVVLKLSNLMRYLLHETNAKYVKLSKEVNYIKDYIDLEKLRYQNRVDISFNVYGNIKDVYIAPMLILPFVENSFKHGVCQDTEETWITIELSVQGNQLTLKVENSLAPDIENIINSDYIKGIGLHNVKRRLELIYKDRYELKNVKGEFSFQVILKLNLNEYETD